MYDMAIQAALGRKEESTMGAYVEQLECLNCSQSRSFMLHGDREQRLVGQAEAVALGKRGVLTCARCGGRNLIRGWTDSVPFAVIGRPTRKRRSVPSSAVGPDN
jgi:hypothetical protein